MFGGFRFLSKKLIFFLSEAQEQVWHYDLMPSQARKDNCHQNDTFWWKESALWLCIDHETLVHWLHPQFDDEKLVLSDLENWLPSIVKSSVQTSLCFDIWCPLIVSKDLSHSSNFLESYYHWEENKSHHPWLLPRHHSMREILRVRSCVEWPSAFRLILEQLV